MRRPNRFSWIGLEAAGVEPNTSLEKTQTCRPHEHPLPPSLLRNNLRCDWSATHTCDASFYADSCHNWLLVFLSMLGVNEYEGQRSSSGRARFLRRRLLLFLLSMFPGSDDQGKISSSMNDDLAPSFVFFDKNREMPEQLFSKWNLNKRKRNFFSIWTSSCFWFFSCWDFLIHSELFKPLLPWSS